MEDEVDIKKLLLLNTRRIGNSMVGCTKRKTEITFTFLEMFNYLEEQLSEEVSRGFNALQPLLMCPTANTHIHPPVYVRGGQ